MILFVDFYKYLHIVNIYCENPFIHHQNILVYTISYYRAQLFGENTVLFLLFNILLLIGSCSGRSR